ncbi:hypothetical protein DSO57_1034493 [Entomophthora muscae]|uniref:Uncharacterized protein n=1 Tax=Entomophthora muscae TaxID=34485 RepID=A0ACC2TY54_9FUNG|nr:hypothetical protein DSO57_1034493 [Entomophthora muscae]
MCGVLFILGVVPPSSDPEVSDQPALAAFFSRLTSHDIPEMNAMLSNRGPDVSSFGSALYSSSAGSPKVLLGFWGHTLFLRGTQATRQPLVHPKTGDMLCWNGEVFGGLEVPLESNDGQTILDLLAGCQTHGEIAELFCRLEGPHGFVFYKASLGAVYFGRDKLGIRSLLKATSPSGKDGAWLSLASLGPSSSYIGSDSGLSCSDWEEVDTNTLFYIDLKTLERTSKPVAKAITRPSSYLTISTKLLEDPLPEFPQSDSKGSGELTLAQEIFRFHLTQKEYIESVQGLEKALLESIRRRVVSIPQNGEAARLGILFSGGIDCTMLAYYAHRFLPAGEPLDLLNVSFENPRIAALSVSKGQAPPPAPDRISGLSSLEELKLLCPGREFRFIAIDITFAEVEACRDRLLVLLHPNVTEMDLSIAMAFWFAARGRGTLSTKPYTSEAKVLLSGLGADEQLAGYSRHRSAFERGSIPELVKEVQLDVSRISTRNLGRDDRVVSDQGKEARYPYLDGGVMAFLNRLPVQIKAAMHYPRGIGEKFLLRLLASQVGFTAPASFPKRAVQFGARTAKMRPGDAKSKGHHLLKPDKSG